MYRFNVYLSTNDPLKLQIWRPNNGKFTLVGEMEYAAQDWLGVHRVSSVISLTNGNIQQSHV